jgi:hypothetical protein
VADEPKPGADDTASGDGKPSCPVCGEVLDASGYHCGLWLISDSDRLERAPPDAGAGDDPQALQLALRQRFHASVLIFALPLAAAGV